MVLTRSTPPRLKAGWMLVAETCRVHLGRTYTDRTSRPPGNPAWTPAVWGRARAHLAFASLKIYTTVLKRPA